MSLLVRQDLGGLNNGQSFPLQYPAAMGMRTGQWVDALELNGTRYGGDGGGLPSPGIITLGDDEYWNSFKVLYTDGAGTGFIDNLFLGLSTGQGIEGGGNAGKSFQATQVLILRVGGRYIDRQLTALSFEYIQSYTPSVVVDHGFAVLDFKPGQVTIKTYESSTVQFAQSYDEVTSHVQELSINASAQGEFYAKFAASTGLKETATSTTDIKQSTTTTLENVEYIEDIIARDQTAVLICAIRILKDSDGRYWFYPTNGANWAKLTAAQAQNLIGYYDFSSGIEAQFGLVSQERYGFRVLAQT